MSRLSTPSPQRIRDASDASVWDSDNVDPFDTYTAQQRAADTAALDADIERRRVADILSEFTLTPAGVGTGATAAAPSARPAGVGVTTTSPRRSVSSFRSPSSAASAASSPPVGCDQHDPQFDHASHRQRAHESSGRNATAATVQHHGSRFGRVRGHAAILCRGCRSRRPRWVASFATTLLVPFNTSFLARVVRTGSTPTTQHSSPTGTHQSSRSGGHATTIGFVGGRCPTAGQKPTHSQHHAYQHRHHGVRRQRRTPHGTSYLQPCQQSIKRPSVLVFSCIESWYEATVDDGGPPLANGDDGAAPRNVGGTSCCLP